VRQSIFELSYFIELDRSATIALYTADAVTVGEVAAKILVDYIQTDQGILNLKHGSRSVNQTFPCHLCRLLDAKDLADGRSNISQYAI